MSVTKGDLVRALTCLDDTIVTFHLFVRAEDMALKRKSVFSGTKTDNETDEKQQATSALAN